MCLRWQRLSQVDMNSIHDASIKVLKDVGVRFHEPEAVKIFKQNGVKTDGDIVFIDDGAVTKALETAPSKFVVNARNPEKNVIFDENALVIAPAGGAVFVVTDSGDQRAATMDDYNNFCKLVHTSKYLDMNGMLMVTPSEISQETYHMDMLYSNIVYCDKVFMGGVATRQAAVDSIEMAGILWGNKDKIKNKPVMIGNVSALSPLQWSKEMTGALIEYARSGQALRLNTTPAAGSTGPVKLAGLLTLVNTELLAAITLSQLIRPGVPVIYGSSCAPTNMRTGGFSASAPEAQMLASGVAQMAHFYELPSRGVGAVTEAHYPDIQAGIESALGLVAAIMGGINFIIQSFGMLSSGMSISYDKFIIDEELCGMILRTLNPIEVSPETIDLTTIAEVGIGGEYLTHPKTFEHFKSEFFISDVMSRKNYTDWLNSGKKRLEEKMKEVVQQRLQDYVKPKLDPGIEKSLSDYIAKRKNE